MDIKEKITANQGERPKNVEPDLIIIHGTTGSDKGDLSWILNGYSDISYHYLVQRDGTIYRLVQEDRRAWHAGVSQYEYKPNCNNYSIGIGISNLGSKELYTKAQYKAAGALCADIMQRWDIPLERIVGHYHVSPGRKTDPWYHFEWSKLHAAIQDHLNA